MKETSQVVRQMERSGIREVFDLASTIPDAIHLEMGEPDFPTPAHVVEAAGRAAAAGYTKYTPNAGIPLLREALSDKIQSTNGVDASPDRVLVTPGAIAALYGSFLTLCDPGDQVLIADPAWPNYQMIASVQGLEAVRYPLRFEDGLLPRADLIEPLITDRTKLLVINSPSNPTGAVLEASDLKSLLELAAARDLWVLSDEVYDEMFFDAPAAPSAANIGDPERIVSVWSFSKTYAMTGWRVGYLLAPQLLVPLLLKTPEAMTACVNAPAQMAAVAALTGPQDCVDQMRIAYRDRRDEVSALLGHAGIPHVVPSGAFYTWIDISATGMLSTDFVRQLLLETHVAVTPGRTFGPASDDFVRVSLATESALLLEGTRRLVDAMTDWS